MLTEDTYTLADLLHIVARLRDPDTGCLWDIKHTHQSLVRYLLEETYEVIDEIVTENPDALKEELGDLLFQIVMHSQLAHEQQQFDLADVIHAISAKMLRRHPHVFGDQAGLDLSESEINALWQQVKEQEGKTAPKNRVAAIPSNRPALTYAHDLGKEAAKYGFDWADSESVLAKISEEVEEIRMASPVDQAEEIGDLLFASLQLCRKANLDPEVTLRQASHKFRDRFTAMLELEGDVPETLPEWEQRWNSIKGKGND